MPAEAWIPLALNVKERLRRDNRWLWVLGRLKPGVSFSAGAAEDASHFGAAKRKLIPIPIKPGGCDRNRWGNSSPER